MSGPPTQTTRVLVADGEARRVVRPGVIEVVSGPDAGVRARLDKPLFRIGTHASNDLVLADGTVSKHHLEVAVVADGYRISDLGSSNGTFFGSARVGELTVLDPVTLQL